MTMRSLCLLIAAGWLAAAPAQAATHDGKWTAKWADNTGKPLEAVVQLAGDAGTYRMFVHQTRGTANACDKLEAPVRVKSESDGKLVLVVDYGAALAGCRNRTLTLKPVDDRTWKGTYSNATATEVVLTRE